MGDGQQGQFGLMCGWSCAVEHLLRSLWGGKKGQWDAQGKLEWPRKARRPWRRGRAAYASGSQPARRSAAIRGLT